jgi:penicillin amidase
MVLLRRLFRILNSFILVLLLALCIGFWWLFWRPLPQTSGEVIAPIAANATVTWDKLGVPHIHAASQDDAFFVQGYVTASERLWQMDSLRRAAAGDLCELVGPAALELDMDSRRLRMRRMAEIIATQLTPKDHDDVAAYARGVNHFIDTHRDRLSFEFALLGYGPRPWTLVDTVLIGLYMFRDLTTSWPEHVEEENLQQHGDPAKVAYLFPSRAGNELQPGSNAWAVSGAHTAHGHPQLSSDMHLSYSIPGVWFMASLDAPGLKVDGVTLPGVPGVIVGHNERIAWGVTNLHFNVQDLYREKLDDRTGQYEFEGKMEQAKLERDLIPVKNQKAVELNQWVTRHGPVIVNDHGEHLALRWTAAEPNSFHLTFTDINRAHNWTEFNAAVAQFPGPGQNFVYADVDGNIGYHASGKLPIRHGFTGDTPLDGASGKYEWDGFIPYDQLPQSFNPPSGYIVTSNQNPFPVNYPYQVSGEFASPYRSNQIRAMLQAKAKLTPQDTLAIQKDVYSAFEDHLSHAIVSAWDRHQENNADLKPAIDELRAFNGQMDKDHIAPLIAVRADYYVRLAAADCAAPGYGREYMDPPISHAAFNMSYAAVDELIAERPAGWFGDYDRMLLTALRDAINELDRSQGRNMSKWRYGNYLEWHVDQPVGSKLPLIAGLFDIDPVHMSGGSTTVKQTTRRLGPSERLNAVVGDWDQSLLNIPFGQSGHVLSKHYKDEWDAYYNGYSFPMPFEHVDAVSNMTFKPQ